MRVRTRTLFGLSVAVAAIGLLLAVGRVCLRPSVNLQSGWQASSCGSRLTPRVLLLIVDAMRIDVFNSAAFDDLRSRHPEAASGVVRTSPISMTTAAVRSLMTGTYPDLFDVLHNWGNVATPLPSVPAAVRRAGMAAATFGDNVWIQMFPADFVVVSNGKWRPAIVHYLLAETAPDEDTLKDLQEWHRKGGGADFTVVHLIGLDHSGHRHGIKNDRYADIMRRTATHIKAAIDDFPPDTTVLITADHGATDGGGHGGASPAETEVPLFAFGPGLVPRASVSLHQVDFAPSLACLLGLPIPEGSIGRPAVELFSEGDAARAARLDAGLEGIRHTWGRMVSSPQVPSAPAANAPGGLDARLRAYQDALATFMSSSTRGRYPLAAWALVLFVLLLGRERRAQISRTACFAVAALLLGALALGLVASAPLLALGLLVMATFLVLPGLRAHGTGNDTPTESARDEAPLLVWVITAGLAVAAALGRDHQRRATTLLFGSPHPRQLLLVGSLLGFALTVRWWWRFWSATRRHADGRRWLAPILCLLVVEGGDPAIVAGAGIVLGALLACLFDLVAGRIGEAIHAEKPKTPATAGRGTRWLQVSMGVAAQAGLVLLLLEKTLRNRLGQARPAVGFLGVALAGLCLWLQGTPRRLSTRTLAVAALPLAVLLLPLLRSTSLGETAVQMSILLGLVGLVAFRLAATKQGANWAFLATLVALWLVLSTPGQRVVIGLALAVLFGLLHVEGQEDTPRPRTLLLLAFVVVSWRWSLVGLFEGVFGFGDFEISLAYLGNPQRSWVQAGLTILLKAWLPLTIALVATSQRESIGTGVRSFAQTLGFVLGLRVVHLAIAIAASPSSFYAVYRLLGELVYELGILGGAALAAWIVCGRTDRRAASSSPALPTV